MKSNVSLGASYSSYHGSSDLRLVIGLAQTLACGVFVAVPAMYAGVESTGWRDKPAATEGPLTRCRTLSPRGEGLEILFAAHERHG